MKILRYIVGNPASGKSTLVNKFKQDLCGKGFYVHDVNNFKDYSLSLTQQQIHDKSVVDAEKALLPIITANKNIVVEATYRGFSKSVAHIPKFLARGYYIEVFYILPSIVDELLRNEDREHPTPPTQFVKSISQYYFEVQLKYMGVGYTHMLDYTSNIRANSIYSETRFYKHIDVSKIDASRTIFADTSRRVAMDTNAIHYCDSITQADVYKTDNTRLCWVNPIGKIYRFGNVFYSKGVEVTMPVTVKSDRHSAKPEQPFENIFSFWEDKNNEQ